MRRSRRLRVFPAAVGDEADAGRLQTLYETLLDRAIQGGYRQLVVAPIADNDERAREALSALGARRTQQFTIYEKQY